MEPMVEYLRGCLKHANLDTMTKGDMKKNYMKDKGLAHFSKDDKKLFSEAILIVLKELTSENKNSNVEDMLNSKGEDMVTEVASDGNVNGNHMESDSDVDFSADNIEKSSSITEPAFKIKSGRKILSDSEMSADEKEQTDVQVVVAKEEVNNETGISGKKTDSLPSLSENDENSGDAIFRVPIKKKNQKIISDDESSQDIPVESKSNRKKRLHSSSSSENDGNSSFNLSRALKTTAPKQKKIKVSDDSQEKKSRKNSLGERISDRNLASDDNDWTLKYSSDSEEDRITEKPNSAKILTDHDLTCQTNFVKQNSNIAKLTHLTNEKLSNFKDLNVTRMENVVEKRLQEEHVFEDITIKKLAIASSESSNNSEVKPIKKFENTLHESSGSENEPLSNLSNKSLPRLKKSRGKGLANLTKNNLIPSKKSKGEPLINISKSFSDSSNSENKPLANLSKTKSISSHKSITKSQINLAKRLQVSSGSEDEPLANLSKNSYISLHKSINVPLPNLTNNYCEDSSSSEDEPLANLSKNSLINSHKSINVPLPNLTNNYCEDSSSSEDEPLANLSKNSLINSHKSINLPLPNLTNNLCEDSSSSEDEPLANLSKNSLINSHKSINLPLPNLASNLCEDSSSSEDKPLANLSKNSLLPFKKSKFKQPANMQDLSDSENEVLINLAKSKSMLSQKSIKKNSEYEQLTKLSHAKNISKDKRNVIDSSDSENEIIGKPRKKKKSTASNKSGAKSTKKNVSDSEEESLASLKQVSPSALCQSEDESDSMLSKTEFGKSPPTNFTKQKKLGKSQKELNKKDASESGDEPLTNFTKQKKLRKTESGKSYELENQDTSESENEALTYFTKQKKLGKSQKELNKKDASESEDEPLTNFTKQKELRKTESGKSHELENQDTSESENEALTYFTKQKKLGKSQKELDKKDASESEDEPLTDFTKQEKLRETESRKSHELDIQDTSESEDEPLANFAKSKEDAPSNSNSIKNNSSGESEDEPIINLSRKNAKTFKQTPDKNVAEKKEKELSDSDDEPGEKLNSSGGEKADKSSLETESSCSSADENEEKSQFSKKNSKSTKEKKVSKSDNKKKLPSDESKIEYFKKYIRALGIKVTSYKQLFANCDSYKGKREKILDLLKQHGMKGRPTLQKCKKLKKKMEAKKMIAELDLSNIIKTDGRRPKRSVCSDSTNYEKAPTPVKFSRLKDIVDSEGSD